MDVFDLINEVEDWETDMFGEKQSREWNSEILVNLYVYLIGEEVMDDIMDNVEMSISC